MIADELIERGLKLALDIQRGDASVRAAAEYQNDAMKYLEEYAGHLRPNVLSVAELKEELKAVDWPSTVGQKFIQQAIKKLESDVVIGNQLIDFCGPRRGVEFKEHLNRIPQTDNKLYLAIMRGVKW